MKAREKFVLSLAIITILSAVGMGCRKKEQGPNYWPQGINGKFVFQTENDNGLVWPDHRVWRKYYVMDANGISSIGSEPVVSYAPVKWSRDGKKMIIGGGGDTFYILNADGNGQIEVKGYNPIYSPDGTKIAFQHIIYVQDANIGDSICTVNLDGSGLKHLYYFDLRYRLSELIHEWSPDGKNIAFVTQKLNNKSYFIPDSLGFINENGITLLAGGDKPHWSTDGSQLYFYNANAIWSNTLSDYSIRKLADIPENTDTFLQWSPDNTRLVCSGYQEDKKIYIINLDGSGQVILSDVPGTAGYFCWSPDGAKFAYISGSRCFTIINSDGSGLVNFSIGEELINDLAAEQRGILGNYSNSP